MLFQDCRVLRIVAGNRSLSDGDAGGDLMRPHLATNRAVYGNRDKVISGMSSIQTQEKRVPPNRVA
jgi:hypothetical protein